jgi:hypothetical protein
LELSRALNYIRPKGVEPSNVNLFCTDTLLF